MVQLLDLPDEILELVCGQLVGPGPSTSSGYTCRATRQDFRFRLVCKTFDAILVPVLLRDFECTIDFHRPLRRSVDILDLPPFFTQMTALATSYGGESIRSARLFAFFAAATIFNVLEDFFSVAKRIETLAIATLSLDGMLTGPVQPLMHLRHLRLDVRHGRLGNFVTLIASASPALQHVIIQDVTSITTFLDGWDHAPQLNRLTLLWNPDAEEPDMHQIWEITFDEALFRPLRLAIDPEDYMARSYREGRTLQQEVDDVHKHIIKSQMLPRLTHIHLLRSRASAMDILHLLQRKLQATTQLVVTVQTEGYRDSWADQNGFEQWAALEAALSSKQG